MKERHSPRRSLCVYTGLLALTLFFLPCAATHVLAQPDGAEPATEADETLETEAQALLEEIKEAGREMSALAANAKGAGYEDRLLQLNQINQAELEALKDTETLLKNMAEQQEQGKDPSLYRSGAKSLLTEIATRTQKRVESLADSIDDLRDKREKVSAEEGAELDERLSRENALENRTLEVLMTSLAQLETLEMDTDRQRNELAALLTGRADKDAGLIEMAMEQIGILNARIKKDPDNAALKSKLVSVEAKLERVLKNLDNTVDVMEELQLDTASYKQVMIQATGDITLDVLDTKVAMGLFQQWVDSSRDWLVKNGPGLFFKAILFALILVLFRILARLARRVVHLSIQNSKLRFSQLLEKMFLSLTSKAVMLVGVLVALSQVGVKMGPVLAGLGIAGFVVGFALQDVLSNFASGLMILIYRPFDMGDKVEVAGAFGVVREMNMVSTTILTFDNQTLVVPNSKVWGDVIKNVTAQDVLRVDMVFGIAYDADIPHAEKVLWSILEAHEKILKDPQPNVRVNNLGESSVDFIVRPYAKTDDYWDVYWDITREVKLRFDKEGIGIPFPQRDVHIYETKTA